MKPNPTFRRCPKSFWAYVRSISQRFGYSLRGKDQVKAPSLADMRDALQDSNLNGSLVVDENGNPTSLGHQLHEYFAYRAEVLNETVPSLLMEAAEAEKLFREIQKKAKDKCPFPMNKQRGDKAKPAYLTGLVNMLVSRNIGSHDCDYDPHSLTTITANAAPLRTLSRRVDGAFPSNVNPIAIWEVKEYYYTTTFGSRIADGMEIEELQQNEGVEVKHYLIIDGHGTWWGKGKSYLCRIIDMLHMGYIDEVLVGREVEMAIPALAKSWAKIADTL